MSISCSNYIVHVSSETKRFRKMSPQIRDNSWMYYGEHRLQNGWNVLIIILSDKP